MHFLYDFTVNRIFTKLFNTSNTEVVQYYHILLGCELHGTLLVKRYDKFIDKFTYTSVSFA